MYVLTFYSDKYFVDDYYIELWTEDNFSGDRLIVRDSVTNLADVTSNIFSSAIVYGECE
jgi:hypothetical protein